MKIHIMLRHKKGKVSGKRHIWWKVKMRRKNQIKHQGSSLFGTSNANGFAIEIRERKLIQDTRNKKGAIKEKEKKKKGP